MMLIHLDAVNLDSFSTNLVASVWNKVMVLCFCIEMEYSRENIPLNGYWWKDGQGKWCVDSGIALACELFPADLGNQLVDEGK